MITLIMCIGFAFGTCEKVERIQYPTRAACETVKEAAPAIFPELVYAVCKEVKK